MTPAQTNNLPGEADDWDHAKQEESRKIGWMNGWTDGWIEREGRFPDLATSERAID